VYAVEVTISSSSSLSLAWRIPTRDNATVLVGILTMVMGVRKLALSEAKFK
jgi:hypothetical protein